MISVAGTVASTKRERAREKEKQTNHWQVNTGKLTVIKEKQQSKARYKLHEKKNGRRKPAKEKKGKEGREKEREREREREH